VKRTVSQLFLTAIMVAALIATGEAAPPGANSDIVSESRLTGDWGGLRSAWAEKGVGIELEYTSSYQGLESDDFQYGGKADAFINLDSSESGFWQGVGLRTHFEFRHGPADAFRGGALWPVNSAQALPLGSASELVASSLYVTMKTSENSSILFGKINVLDLLAKDSFFGGWGTRRFMNIAFVAPPSGVLPPVIFGAIFSTKFSNVAWTAMVFDPQDRTNDYLPGDLFSEGVNLSWSGSYAGTLGGRATQYTVGATYSTEGGTDLADFLLPPELEPRSRNGSYNISFQVAHSLQKNADSGGWGVSLKSGIGDGNPNPIRSFVIVGVSKKMLFQKRREDSFGLGYFYYAFGDDLRNALDPVFDLDDEQGVEVYYSLAVSPWMSVTADIQYIDPASGGQRDALVIGLRSNIRF